MNRLGFFLLCFLFASHIAFSQQLAMDSLSFEKFLIGKPFERQVKILDSMAQILGSTDPRRGLDYIEREKYLMTQYDEKYHKGRPFTTASKIYRKLGDFDKALEYQQKAQELNLSTGNAPGLIDGYINFGNIYLITGNYGESIDNFSKALKESEKISDKNTVAICLLNIGNVYFYQQDFKNALIYYERGSKIKEEVGDNEGMALGLDNIALVYTNLGDFKKATEYHHKAFRIIEKSGDQIAIADFYSGMGIFFNEQNSLDSALYYFRKSFETSDKVDYASGKAVALLNMGDVLTNLGRNVEAEESLLAGQEIAMNAGMVLIEAEFCRTLSALFEKTDRANLALKFEKRLTVLQDTMYNQDKVAEHTKMQTKFEVSEKEKEIVKLSVEGEKKQVMIYAFSIGVFLLLILVVLIVRTSMHRKSTNKQLGIQNKIIAEKNKDITDSINYALRIQKSVMPDEEILHKAVTDYFILNKPRDIVSGDFFWLAQKGDFTYAAVADCTGHGVPGALVSVVGINMLNKIIEQSGTPSPSEILDQLHVMVIAALNKHTDARDSNDGMDVGLLSINKKTGKAFFSGASRPLYYSNEEGMHFVRGDRYSIAGEKKETDDPFSQLEIQLSPKTKFYLTSDGFVDQFGEISGKKYLSKRFSDLLKSISDLPMKEQQNKLDQEFVSWKGKLEQVDDVMILGIQI